MHKLEAVFLPPVGVDLDDLPGLPQAVLLGYFQICLLVFEVAGSGGDVQCVLVVHVDDLEIPGGFDIDFLCADHVDQS